MSPNTDFPLYRWLKHYWSTTARISCSLQAYVETTVSSRFLVLKGMSRSNCYSFIVTSLPFEFMHDFFKWKFISTHSTLNATNRCFI